MHFIHRLKRTWTNYKDSFCYGLGQMSLSLLLSDWMNVYNTQVCFTFSCWMHSKMWILHTGYHCAWVVRGRWSGRLSDRWTWQSEGESTEGIPGTPDLLSTQKIIAWKFLALTSQFNFTAHSCFLNKLSSWSTGSMRKNNVIAWKNFTKEYAMSHIPALVGFSVFWKLHMWNILRQILSVSLI